MSPDGNHAYVAGSSDKSVSWFTRNSATGILTYGGTLKDGVGGAEGLDGAFGITFSNDGSYLYITGNYENSVSVYQRNFGTGALVFSEVLRDDYEGVDGLNNAQSVTLSPGGDHIYVVGNGDNAVSTFDLNASSGLLTQTDVIKQGDGSLEGLDGAIGVSALR